MISIALCFRLKGSPVFCEAYGNGHINRTYLVKTDAGAWYILQKINGKVFLDIPALMGNIAAVTRFLALEEPDERRVLSLVKTRDGHDYYTDSLGGFWRMYVFVTDSICLERPETPRDLYLSGLAFGRFQRQLDSFPAATLHETIARFHDTPHRYEQLKTAAEKDIKGRLQSALPELDFIMARAKQAGYLMALKAQGVLPVRVTHNDTKLNNVLFDQDTREPLCVIDLDTVMPGLAAYDFGDTVRFGASTAAEDETDLGRVSMSLDLFKNFSRGFLKECGQSLNQEEVRTLPDGAWAMTLECGVRFLADYLSGDVYFRVHRENHNLDRCRTQLRLVEDMERKRGEMDRIVEETMQALQGTGAV